MRLILVAILLSLAACYKPQGAASEHKQGYVRLTAVHPFPEAASVRLFIENGIDKKSGQATFESNPGRLLSPEQRRAFETLLSVQTPVNLSPDDDFFLMTTCFIPHHFFRYFDKAGHQIGEIAVCFCCAGIEMNPSNLRLKQGERFDFDYGKLKSLVKSWGEPTDFECGLS
jgi:hypothetical protein